VIIAAYLWRHSAANPKPQQAPVTAATHPEAAKNVPVSGSAPATVAKIPPPREDERAGRPAVSTRRQRTPRTTSFRNSAPRTASTANAGSTTMRRVRAASADTVRKPQANNAPAVRPRTRETVQVRRNPTVEQPNADRTEQPEVVRNTPSVGIRNADLGAEEKSTARMDLQERLDGWIAATNAADIGEQMRYYSPSLSAFYLKRNVTTNAVRAEKTRLFARASDVDVWVDEPKIKLSEDGKTATMRFRKQYNIENGRRSRRGAVVQELQWKRDGDDWKIVSERDLRVLR
jgi:ketosteroid isomerase-like protein